ncbi:MAG: hypothetical protein JWP31_347 [Aeromicrobium sp.]|nr:hypothetical protein [Aeromicrobium sp.]
MLSQERPVVEKAVEPVDRFRLGAETVTEEETVTGSASRPRTPSVV